jgi:alanine-glyoxylate transaminase/serine-glyoxylate transaminase/serine-pyruvate transaminase
VRGGRHFLQIPGPTNVPDPVLRALARPTIDHRGPESAVLMPEPYDADRVRRIILDRWEMSLGTGPGRLAGRVFRIGHLGRLGDLELAGALAGVEMGLVAAGVPIARRGVDAALASLESPAEPSAEASTEAAR